MLAVDMNAHPDPDNEIFRYFSTDIFREAIPYGSYVLDCGAGDGAVALPLAAKHGCRVVCLDRDADRLGNIERQQDELPISIQVGDVNEMPFPDDEFDAVYSRMLLSHQVDWLRIVREKLRVCRPGGIVAFQHISKERYEFCASRAVSNDHKAEIAKGWRRRRSRASQGDVRAFCKEAGVELLRIVPLTHFLTSGLVYRTGMTPEEIECFAAEFRQRLQNPEVYDFVRWFERSVIPKLPQEYSEMFIAVIQKPTR